MNTGTILFIAITMVTILDIAMALYFRVLADRVESGQGVGRVVDPAATRKTAAMLLVMAPVIWLVVTLISFGVIPTGIEPARF